MPGNDNATDQVLAEINSCLKQLEQTGGSQELINEINTLFSEYNGQESNLSETELLTMAQNGGAKKRAAKKGGKRKSASKSKSKSRSKGRRAPAKKAAAKRPAAKRSAPKKAAAKKSKSKSRSKGRAAPKRAAPKRAAKAKSKSKSRSKSRKATPKRAAPKRAARKSKSKSRSKSRKQSRPMNPFMQNLVDLRRWIMETVPRDEFAPMNVGAMSSAASNLLKANDVDAEKAKKAFDKAAFMTDYKAAVKRINAKKEAKKAAKAN